MEHHALPCILCSQSPWRNRTWLDHPLQLHPFPFFLLLSIKLLYNSLEFGCDYTTPISQQHLLLTQANFNSLNSKAILLLAIGQSWWWYYYTCFSSKPTLSFPFPWPNPAEPCTRRKKSVDKSIYLSMDGHLGNQGDDEIELFHTL